MRSTSRPASTPGGRTRSIRRADSRRSPPRPFCSWWRGALRRMTARSSARASRLRASSCPTSRSSRGRRRVLGCADARARGDAVFPCGASGGRGRVPLPRRRGAEEGSRRRCGQHALARHRLGGRCGGRHAVRRVPGGPARASGARRAARAPLEERSAGQHGGAACAGVRTGGHAPRARRLHGGGRELGTQGGESAGHLPRAQPGRRVGRLRGRQSARARADGGAPARCGGAAVPGRPHAAGGVPAAAGRRVFRRRGRDGGRPRARDSTGRRRHAGRPPRPPRRWTTIWTD